MLRKIAVAQLLLKALGETLLDGKGIVFGAFVLAPVVDMQVVGRDVVVLGTVVLFQRTAALLLLLYLGDGDVTGFVVPFGCLVIDDGVVVHYLPDILLQGLHRHFDYLDGLDLKR